MEIDGLTIQEVKWNIYAFGCKAKEFARKRDNARFEHTKAKWQKKCANAAGYLANNQERLARANAAEQSVHLTTRKVRAQVKMSFIRQVDLEVDDSPDQDFFEMVENEALRQFGSCDEIEITEVENFHS